MFAPPTQKHRKGLVPAAMVLTLVGVLLAPLAFYIAVDVDSYQLNAGVDQQMHKAIEIVTAVRSA